MAISHVLIDLTDDDDVWAGGGLFWTSHSHPLPLDYACIDAACTLTPRNPDADTSRHFLVVMLAGAVQETEVQLLYDWLVDRGIPDPFSGKPPPKWRGAHLATLARAMRPYVLMSLVDDADPLRLLPFHEAEAIIDAWSG